MFGANRANSLDQDERSSLLIRGNTIVERGKTIWDEFLEFMNKGNVLAIGVGLVSGAAFQSLTKSMVEDILSPPLGLLAGSNFNNIFIVLKKGENATMHYMTIAQAQGRPNLSNFCLFVPRNSTASKQPNGLLFVHGSGRCRDVEHREVCPDAHQFLYLVQVLLRESNHRREEQPPKHSCQFCRSEIPKGAVRCKFCTSWVDEQHNLERLEVGSSARG
ncbi:uncharacterized protein VTP21DRAFT_8464 [Calcarisporiella thermophila]|uniref:uncharacterized protein n=1 Tax=Calcarisporiella thermophila TaxID=911321 RepID=UPI0037447C16